VPFPRRIAAPFARLPEPPVQLPDLRAHRFSRRLELGGGSLQLGLKNRHVKSNRQDLQDSQDLQDQIKNRIVWSVFLG
jgi:hypothetical protein